MKQPGSSWKC